MEYLPIAKNMQLNAITTQLIIQNITMISEGNKSLHISEFLEKVNDQFRLILRSGRWLVDEIENSLTAHSCCRDPTEDISRILVRFVLFRMLSSSVSK